MRSLTFNKTYDLPYANTEAFNRLRVNMDLFGSRYKTVLISSSVPDEGKSYVSVNLWRSLAEAGKKVLLIDTDIRRSNMRSLYGMRVADGGENLGIAAYLAEQASMNDIVYKTDYENAYIIPVFRTISNPAILLQGDLLGQLIHRMSETFDIVLVDTPPLETVSDGVQVASHCDGALLVVRAGSTSRHVVSNTVKQLGLARCELLGIILNRVDAKYSSYYHKYSHYSYYSYYSRYGS